MASHLRYLTERLIVAPEESQDARHVVANTYCAVIDWLNTTGSSQWDPQHRCRALFPTLPHKIREAVLSMERSARYILYTTGLQSRLSFLEEENRRLENENAFLLATQR